MRNEIDPEKDFAEAKAMCASKMIKDNRSFIEFCDARAQAFVKNYMKDPSWEWDFSHDDIEYAKHHAFDDWYKKIDIRDYFVDSSLLKKLLAGLSADEVKVLLYSEMEIFYDAFTKDAREDRAKDAWKDFDGPCEEFPKENETKTEKCEKGIDDAAKALKKALDAARGFHDGKAAQQNAEKSAEHRENDENVTGKGKEKCKNADLDGDMGGDLDGDLNNDDDFLCADLKDVVDSLYENIGALAKELKDILSEDKNEEEAPKKKEEEKKNENQNH